jgi:hypothetical protein
MVCNRGSIGDCNGAARRVGNDNNHGHYNNYDNYNDSQQCGGGSGGGTRRMCWCSQRRPHPQSNLKNGNNNGIVVDGSLLEDIVTGIGAGVMDGNSPTVGMFQNEVDNDVHCSHLAVPSF